MDVGWWSGDLKIVIKYVEWSGAGWIIWIRGGTFVARPRKWFLRMCRRWIRQKIKRT